MLYMYQLIVLHLKYFKISRGLGFNFYSHQYWDGVRLEINGHCIVVIPLFCNLIIGIRFFWQFNRKFHNKKRSQYWCPHKQGSHMELMDKSLHWTNNWRQKASLPYLIILSINSDMKNVREIASNVSNFLWACTSYLQTTYRTKQTKA